MVVHPNPFHNIFTMIGSRVSSFEQSWRDVSEFLVHPVPRPLARTRRVMTSVAAQDKDSVIVKMLFSL